MRTLLVSALVVWLMHLGPGLRPAAAQSSITPLEFYAAGEPPPGWSFTPAIDYALVWDSNVLMENVGSTIVSEQLHVLKPRGTVSFVGRRTNFNALYGGAFVQHPNLSSLDSYEQRVSASGQRLLSRRTTISATYSAVDSPTTELVELVGVPFTRIGTQRHHVRAGMTTQLSRVSGLTTAYRFQRIDFDELPSQFAVLNGGYSHGGTAAFTQSLTERVSLMANYDIDRAIVIDGSTFLIQNGRGGAEYTINRDTRVYGSAGVSYLSSVEGRPARTGPSIDLGLVREVQDATVSVGYSRSFVPSYSFGGTSDNEELRATIRMPLARRLVTRSAVSYRINQPLELSEDLELRTLWFHGSVGYLLTGWAQVEAYVAGSRQHVERPDGRVNRTTVGIQITAATTTRIR
jgi:hypothetical protein